MASDRMQRVRIHMIADDALMAKLSAATKMVANPRIISELKQAGIAAAEEFLRGDVDNIGTKSSVDLRDMFG